MSILIHKDNKGEVNDDFVNEAMSRIGVRKEKVRCSATVAMSKIAPCVVIENKKHKGVIAPKVKVSIDGVKGIDVDKIRNEAKSEYETVCFDKIHKESIDVEEGFDEKVIDPKGDVRDTQADRLNLFRGFKYTKDPLGLYIKDSNDKEDDEEEEEEENHFYQLRLIPLEQRLIDMFDLNIK